MKLLSRLQIQNSNSKFTCGKRTAEFQIWRGYA